MPAFRNKLWDGKIRLFTLRERTLPAGLYYHLQEFTDKRQYNLLTETSKYGKPDDRTHIKPEFLLNF